MISTLVCIYRCLPLTRSTMSRSILLQPEAEWREVDKTMYISCSAYQNGSLATAGSSHGDAARTLQVKATSTTPETLLQAMLIWFVVQLFYGLFLGVSAQEQYSIGAYRQSAYTGFYTHAYNGWGLKQKAPKQEEFQFRYVNTFTQGPPPRPDMDVVSNVPVEGVCNCCLIDEGQRCSHPATSATFNKRQVKNPQQRRRQLLPDPEVTLHSLDLDICTRAQSRPRLPCM